MMLQTALQAVEPHDSNAAILAEILAINSGLSDLQSRVSRLAQQMATRQVTVPFDEHSSDVLQAIADAMGLTEEQMQPAPAFTPDPAPSAPPAPYVPQSPACQSVLNLYGESVLSPAEISRQLKMHRSSVGCYLSMGRKAADPRVVKGDATRRQPAPQPQEDEVADVVETVIVPVDESAPEPQGPTEPVEAEQSSTRIFRRVPRYAEDEGPARLRIPSVPAPAPKSKPVEAPAEQPRGEPVSDFDADKIMVVDVQNLKVHGPWGSVDVVRPFARSLERMTDGATYDIDTLRDLGPWPRTDAMKDHFGMMRSKLAAIGVELVTVNKFMFRVRRREA